MSWGIKFVADTKDKAEAEVIAIHQRSSAYFPERAVNAILQVIQCMPAGRAVLVQSNGHVDAENGAAEIKVELIPKA